jgi:predicted DNA-binding antitoxin AbrB/MazE fold protein
MTKNIDAVYENGVFRPLEPIDMAENQKVTLTITNGSPNNTDVQDFIPPQFATRDEWQHAIGSWAKSHARTGADADWSRENIYAGRGE